MRVGKATETGLFLEIAVKMVASCRCLDGHVKEPYEMPIAWEPIVHCNITASFDEWYVSFNIREDEVISSKLSICRHGYNWNVVNCDTDKKNKEKMNRIKIKTKNINEAI